MAQQRLGHTVAVLTSDRFFPFPNYQATIQPLLGARVVGSGAREECGLQAYRLPIAFECRHHLWLRGFERALAEFEPEVVHVHEPFTLPAFQSALAKPRNGYGLLIASSMEKEVFYPQSFPRQMYYQLHAAFVAPVLRRQVDVFTAVGEGAREVLSQVLSLPIERVEFVPLGADSERFRFDAAARREVRRELGVADDLVLVVYAGKLIADKDVHVLAAAVGRAKPRAPLGLLLLGNGTSDYCARLSELAKAGRHPIFLRPAIPNQELPRFFSAADIGVWPSQSSNAAIEAALAGLPLVVSESQATGHYVEAGNGLAFPRGEVASLAGCLERLADAPESRREMAARGRAHLEREMSWDCVARRYLNLYQGIVEAAQGKASTK